MASSWPKAFSHHDIIKMYVSYSTRYKTNLVCCIYPRDSPYITNVTDLVRMILNSIIWAHSVFSIEMIRFITMGQCKTGDSLLQTHWRYRSLAASHRYIASKTITKLSLQADNFEVSLLLGRIVKSFAFNFSNSRRYPAYEWMTPTLTHPLEVEWRTHVSVN